MNEICLTEIRTEYCLTVEVESHGSALSKTRTVSEVERIWHLPTCFTKSANQWIIYPSQRECSPPTTFWHLPTPSLTGSVLTRTMV